MHGWGTESEINFIRGLGSYKGKNSSDKKTLLKKYVESIRLRKNWGSINREAIIKAAERELAQI